MIEVGAFDADQFDGTFAALTKAGGTVITETYPADVYARLGVAWPRGAAGAAASDRSGKGSQAARQRNAAAIRSWAG